MKKIIESIKGEIFKDVDGYKISNLGRVIGKSGRLLNPTVSPAGYRVITVGGKTYHLHRLIASVFIGEIPKNMQVNHINGDKGDNSVDNLEIITRSENALHAYRIGLKHGMKGEENAMAELSEKEVFQIYDMILDHKSNDEIAVFFKVHPRYVSLIRHGKRWGHLFFKHDVSKLTNLERVSFGNSKVDFNDALNLLSDLKSGEISQKEIAKKYGIDKTTVSHIKRRKTWHHYWECHDQKNLATTIEKTD